MLLSSIAYSPLSDALKARRYVRFAVYTLVLLPLWLTSKGRWLPHKFNCGEKMKSQKPATRKQELHTFLFLTIVTAPVLSVMAVGGYGFCVWMMQLVTGRLPGG